MEIVVKFVKIRGKDKEEIKMQKWTRVMYQPNLPLGENGEKVTASSKHITLSKEAAKEGMVLLKNDGDLLPLAKEIGRAHV